MMHSNNQEELNYSELTCNFILSFDNAFIRDANIEE